MANRVFYFKGLTTSQKWSIGIYLIITFVLFFIFERVGEYILAYCVISQIGLYLFYYKALRNLTFYMLCLGIGGLHLVLFYLILADHQSTLLLIQHASNLRNTLPLLVLFQILRCLNLFIQGQELVSPQRSSFKDIHDKRYVMPSDYLFLMVYVFFLVALIFGWEYP